MWIVTYFDGKDKTEETFKVARLAFGFATFLRQKLKMRVQVKYIRKERKVEKWR